MTALRKYKTEDERIAARKNSKRVYYERNREKVIQRSRKWQLETVSGLHVPWNLQILPYYVNISKGNKHDGTNA